MAFQGTCSYCGHDGNAKSPEATKRKLPKSRLPMDFTSHTSHQYHTPYIYCCTVSVYQGYQAYQGEDIVCRLQFHFKCVPKSFSLAETHSAKGEAPSSLPSTMTLYHDRIAGAMTATRKPFSIFIASLLD